MVQKLHQKQNDVAIFVMGFAKRVTKHLSFKKKKVEISGCI